VYLTRVRYAGKLLLYATPTLTGQALMITILSNPHYAIVAALAVAKALRALALYRAGR